MDKIVHVKRRPYAGNKPDEIVASEKWNIGGALAENTDGVLKGLTYDEEQLLMPALVTVPANHPDFMRKSYEWFANIKKHVPNSGISLNVSLTDDTKELGDVLSEVGDVKRLNMPKNIHDYVFWKYCLAYRRVCNTKEDLDWNAEAPFYLYSEQEEIDKVNKVVNMRTDAMKLFTKIQENESVMNQVIRTLSGTHEDIIRMHRPENFSPKEKQNLLSTIAVDHPDKFHKVASDADLGFRADVYEMLDKGIISKAGNSYFFESEEIGKSVEMVIGFMKSPANSKIYSIMKGKLETAQVA